MAKVSMGLFGAYSSRELGFQMAGFGEQWQAAGTGTDISRLEP